MRDVDQEHTFKEGDSGEVVVVLGICLVGFWVILSSWVPDN